MEYSMYTEAEALEMLLSLWKCETEKQMSYDNSAVKLKSSLPWMLPSLWNHYPSAKDVFWNIVYDKHKEVIYWNINTLLEWSRIFHVLLLTWNPL